MTRQIRRLATVAALGVSVTATIVSAGQSAAVQTARPMTLAVAGATSTAPSLAALDRTVMAVWPAALPATLINEGEPRKAFFYAISRDGRTFSPRVRVPTAGITPGHPQMALLSDGGAALVWDETVNGLRRVSLSRVSADRRTFEPAQVLSGGESVSHPVIARSGATLIVAWASRDEPVVRLQRLSVSR